MDALENRARLVFRALAKRYPDAHCALDWTKPHELLIATILSAQATDVGVNKATPALFAAFPTVRAFASASPAEIEPYVKTINFWRMKAKAVSESMRTIEREHGGEVPRTMQALVQLRGVARKTANVVLGNAFAINEGVVVDTHVMRLAQRFSLTKHAEPLKIERDLMQLFARKHWCQLSHLLIAHGRAVCKARGNTCATDSICQQFCSEANLKRTQVTSRRPSKVTAKKKVLAMRSDRRQPTATKQRPSRRKG